MCHWQVDEFDREGAWGLEMPLSTCWQLYAVRARTIVPAAGWETGRESSVEFMGFNLKSLVRPDEITRARARPDLFSH